MPLFWHRVLRRNHRGCTPAHRADGVGVRYNSLAHARGPPVSRRMIGSRRTRCKKLIDIAALILAGLASLATSETFYENSAGEKGDDVRIEGSPRNVAFRVSYEPYSSENHADFRGEVVVYASTSTAPAARVSLSRADGLLGATEGIVSPGQRPIELRDGDAMRSCVRSPCTVDYILQFAPTSSSTSAASVAWEVTAVATTDEEPLNAPHVTIEILP